MGNALDSIHRTHASVVACYADADALDALSLDDVWRGRAHVCRVAPDELLLITAPSLCSDVKARAQQYFDLREPSALVLDQTDGFAVWTLKGEGAAQSLRSLTVNRFPDSRPAFLQGAVAGAPAKLLLVDGATHLMVPSPLKDYVESRLRDVAGSFGGEAITTAELPLAMDVSPDALVRAHASPVAEPAHP